MLTIQSVVLSFQFPRYNTSSIKLLFPILVSIPISSTSSAKLLQAHYLTQKVRNNILSCSHSQLSHIANVLHVNKASSFGHKHHVKLAAHTRFLAPKIYAYQSCRRKLSHASFSQTHNVEQLGNETSQPTKVLMASGRCFISVLRSLQCRTHAVGSARCMRCGWDREVGQAGMRKRGGVGVRQTFHFGVRIHPMGSCASDLSDCMWH